MTLKEEFLQVKTREELEKNWDKFRRLSSDDKEVVRHLDELLGPAWAPENHHQDALKK